jgi:1-acyl-sn-glycerol-3-phosphate acyltransferase
MKKIFQRQLARLMLWVSGWHLEGSFPDISKCVIIAAPHTSNWDFFYGFVFKLYYGLNMHFLIKKELFRFPFRWFFCWIGGIPVDRSKHGHLVEKLGRKIRRSDSFFLTVSPEGTRKEVYFWKRGFYHIAREAGVPILPGYVDYRRKVVGVGPLFHPGTDMEKDLNEIVSFYSSIQATYPGNFYLPDQKHQA